MKYSILIIILLFIAGCKQQQSSSAQPEIIQYEGPTLSSLRSFFKSIEVIKLDPQQTVTIGPYNVIRQQDSSFYVGNFMVGNEQIYRFNKEGVFLDSIGKMGRAPGEYVGLSDFYIEDKADELYVLSNVDSKILRYRKNGEFIDQKAIPEPTSCFTKMDDIFWLYQGFNNGQQPERLLKTDPSFRVTGKYLPFETQTLNPSIGPLFRQYNSETYLFNAFEPIIYQITKDTVVPFLQFDYGKYNIPESYWKMGSGIKAFMELSQKGFMSLNSFMINDDYIITEQNQQAGQNVMEVYYICGIKDRRTGKWNWIRQQAEGQAMIVNDQEPHPVEHRAEWYANKLKGFTQDGKLMVFLFAHELENMTPEDKALIRNPEKLEQTDPEMDTFLFLCTLK